MRKKSLGWIKLKGTACTGGEIILLSPHIAPGIAQEEHSGLLREGENGKVAFPYMELRQHQSPAMPSSRHPSFLPFMLLVKINASSCIASLCPMVVFHACASRSVDSISLAWLSYCDLQHGAHGYQGNQQCTSWHPLSSITGTGGSSEEPRRHFLCICRGIFGNSCLLIGRYLAWNLPNLLWNLLAFSD